MKSKLNWQVYVRAAEDVDNGRLGACVAIMETLDPNKTYMRALYKDYLELFEDLFKPTICESSFWMSYSEGGGDDKQRILALLLTAEIVKSYHGKPITI
jgi:hypothetical protein